jgi:branched-subunit amino acid aminotransferase/4-amino-4-deoxychorismate lyase
MSIGKYILANGSFFPTDEYRLSFPESEGFLFSEKIRSVRTAFPFFNETLEIIKLQLRIFGHSFPDLTANNGAGMKRQLERTLTKNKHFLGAVFIITFRFTDQKVQYSIRSEKLENTGYELNEKGLYVEILDEIRKAPSSISMLPIGSEMYWKIAANQQTNPMYDHFLILNTQNHVVEIQESNIYLIKGKSIRGASVSQGAYQDISRPLMLNIFRSLGLDYIDNQEISIQNIKDAEEILVVNTIEGVRWILGFEGKRYFNNTIRKISELFNRSVLVE